MSGERVALIGPNGSGKTTVLRCVAGTLAPSSGEVRIRGHEAGSFEARQSLGVSFSQERSFYLRLLGRDNLLFYAGVRGFGRKEAVRLISELCPSSELGIDAILAIRTDRCSTGMVQQLSFCWRSDWLIRHTCSPLDEPTRSLDHDAIARLWSALDRRPATAGNHRYSQRGRHLSAVSATVTLFGFRGLAVVGAIARRDFLVARSYHLACIILDVVYGVLEVSTYCFISRVFCLLQEVRLGQPQATSRLRRSVSCSQPRGSSSATTYAFSGELRNEQLTGTLEALAAQPLTPVELCAGFVSFPLIFALFCAVAYLAVAGVWLHLDVSRVGPYRCCDDARRDGARHGPSRGACGSDRARIQERNPNRFWVDLRHVTSRWGVVPDLCIADPAP